MSAFFCPIRRKHSSIAKLSSNQKLLYRSLWNESLPENKPFKYKYWVLDQHFKWLKYSSLEEVPYDPLIPWTVPEKSSIVSSTQEEFTTALKETFLPTPQEEDDVLVSDEFQESFDNMWTFFPIYEEEGHDFDVFGNYCLQNRLF